MQVIDSINRSEQFSEHVESMKNSIQTEEATKTVTTMPFLSIPDYNMFNPQELAPEFTADVGIKKGEEIDYAIIRDGQPVILIECKSISKNLDRHDSQFFRYFGTTTAGFAILVNGVIYRFYVNLDSPNRISDDPFPITNILDIRGNQVPGLKKFSKSVFDTDSVFSIASELKYVYEFKHVSAGQLDTPADGFIRFFPQGCYSGPRTQNVIEKLRPVLWKALDDLVNEMTNDRIKTVLDGSGESASTIEQKPVGDIPPPFGDSVEQEKRIPNIVTTEKELEAFFIIKNLFADLMDIHGIIYKDTEPHISALYKGNIRKWICRSRLADNQKTLVVPDESKKEHKSTLSDIYEFRNYKGTLTGVLQRYLQRQRVRISVPDSDIPYLPACVDIVYTYTILYTKEMIVQQTSTSTLITT